MYMIPIASIILVFACVVCSSLGENCPEFNETDAFISYTDIHEPEDGLNIFRQKLLKYIDMGICQQRNIVVPMLRTRVGVDEWIAWDEIFDFDSMDKFIYENYGGLHFVNPECVPQDLLVVDPTHDCDLPVAGSIRKLSGYMPSSMSYNAGIDFLAESLNAMQPNSVLGSLIDSIRAKIGETEYVCLHLRTESDFYNMFRRPPGYYTMEQIGSKIKLTIESGHEISGIKYLYVTGEHPNEESKIQTVFGDFFEKTYTKEVAFQEDQFTLKSLHNVQAAFVDQEVCKHAKIFIGNNHSGWSELTYWQRIWDPTKKEFGPFGSHFGTNLMVNAIAPDEPVDNAMHEFCAANSKVFGLECYYYRINRMLRLKLLMV